MKTLAPEETQCVSGGFIRAWPAPRRTGLPEVADALTTAAPVAPQRDDPQRRMVPASVATNYFVPPLRFDALRTAPDDTDEDTYNGFNDRGAHA